MLAGGLTSHHHRRVARPDRAGRLESDRFRAREKGYHRSRGGTIWGIAAAAAALPDSEGCDTSSRSRGREQGGEQPLGGLSFIDSLRRPVVTMGHS